MDPMIALAGGPDDTAPESDGMVRKAPQNLALSEVMQPAATKQFCESPKDMTIIVGGGEVQPVAPVCGGVGGQRRIDARALFARFATLSTLSTGKVNRLIRTGSNSKLDELEAPTLDATGLRNVLRGVGLGVPNSTSVRPMLAEFGEVVGCQPRLTYAQFETLRAALSIGEFDETGDDDLSDGEVDVSLGSETLPTSHLIAHLNVPPNCVYVVGGSGLCLRAPVGGARVVEREVTPISDGVTVLFESSVPSHLTAHIDRKGLCELVASRAARAEQSAAAEKRQMKPIQRMSRAERAEQNAIRRTSRSRTRAAAAAEPMISPRPCAPRTTPVARWR